jgi:molybdenum cofactor cytidylyltransferase
VQGAIGHAAILRYKRVTFMIPAVVLAAGRSTRMGRSKALLPLDSGDTFLSRIVRTLRDASVDDVVVVLGHEPEPIVADLTQRGAAVRFAVNPDFDKGQLSSLVAGLNVIDRPGVIAALVTVVDVPLVSAATVRAVIEQYRTTRAPIVRPVAAGRHGHPVLIDRALFDRFRAADPAYGPNVVVRQHVSADGDVEVTDPHAFRDVDTPDEYDRLLIEVRAS